MKIFLTVLALTAIGNASIADPRARHNEGIEERKAELSFNRKLFSATNAVDNYDVLQYDLHARYDWENKVLLGDLKIDLKLDSAAIHQITLDNRTDIEKITKLSGEPISYTTDGPLLHLEMDSFTPEEKKNPLTIAIVYQAHPNEPSGRYSALRAVLPRAGDPIASRTVYTTSEPQSHREWMPCHDRPLDRAKWKVELRFPKEEFLIANGRLVKDETTGNERVMAYATDYTLPTYLMAFAVGQFEMVTEDNHGVPVGVVYRKGLPIDAQGMAHRMVQVMQHYESLLIPYPFEKYTVVLLPEFVMGGLEHASVTFQKESTTTDTKMEHDFSLFAHEMGHQWFGDYMTISSWDDLWIKEGMATLLAAEAHRSFEDQNHTGRLMGSQFYPDTDAVIDPDLQPDEKYTSGPYDRSAWVLTQIRATVGEDNFWGTLKTILQKHAFGNVTTKSFLAEFSPLLTAEKFDQVNRALYAHNLPTFQFALSSDKKTLNVRLADSEDILIYPLTLGQIKNGAASSLSLDRAHSAVTFSASDGMLVADFKDAHGAEALIGNRKDYDSVMQRWASKDSKDWKFLLSLGGHIQERALEIHFPLDSKVFALVYYGLGSERAKKEGLLSVCRNGKELKDEEKLSWKRSLSQYWGQLPYLAFSDYLTDEGLSICQGLLDEDFLVGIKGRLQSERVSDGDLVVFSAIPYAAPEAFSIWSRLSETGASVRRRSVAYKQLLRQLKGVGQFEAPSQADLPAWKNFFTRGLENDSLEVLPPVITAVGFLKETDALKPLARVVQRKSSPIQSQAICTAFSISGNAEGSLWSSFVEAVGNQGVLTPFSKNLLLNPKDCLK